MRHLVADRYSGEALCGQAPGRRPLVTHVGVVEGDLVALRISAVDLCPRCTDVVVEVERAIGKALWAGVEPGG